MNLAKPNLDMGVFVRNLESELFFWQTKVSIPFDHRLHIKKPITNKEFFQYRHNLNGSVIKINHCVTLKPDNPEERSGFKGVTLILGNSKKKLETANGEFIEILPENTNDLQGPIIHLTSEKPNRLIDFYVSVLGFEKITSELIRSGTSYLQITKGSSGNSGESYLGYGFRYITVQVFDADLECQKIEQKGGDVAMQPVSYGKIARVAFVRDPDGNWIEISARSSLTGVEPPSDPKN